MGQFLTYGAMAAVILAVSRWAFKRMGEMSYLSRQYPETNEKTLTRDAWSTPEGIDSQPRPH